MGAVPRGDSESAEAGGTDGVRRTGVHRPRTLCRAVARLSSSSTSTTSGSPPSVQEAVPGALGRLLAAPRGRVRGEYDRSCASPCSTFSSLPRRPARSPWSRSTSGAGRGAAVFARISCLRMSARPTGPLASDAAVIAFRRHRFDRNRLCQRRQRLLPPPAFGSGSVEHSGPAPSSDGAKQPGTAGWRPHCPDRRRVAALR